jgi:cell division protein FtsZ
MSDQIWNDNESSAQERDEGRSGLVAVGVGNTGGKVVRACVADDTLALRYVMIDDARSAGPPPPGIDVVPVGKKSDGRLKSGGSPEEARQNAEEAAAGIRAQIEGAELVFVVAGLGRGAGSGMGPVAARIAKECGARVISLVALPYELEGTVRKNAAIAALNQLKALSDGVICLPNERLCRSEDRAALTPGTFWRLSDDTLSRALVFLTRLVSEQNFLEISFSDLCAALDHGRAECVFASAICEGDTRAEDAFAFAAKSPLLRGTASLPASASVLAHIHGDVSLNMSEIELITEQLNSKCGDDVRVLIGASQDDEDTGKLTLSLLVSPRSSAAGSEPQDVEMQESSPFKDHLTPHASRRTEELLGPSVSERPPDRSKREAPIQHGLKDGKLTQSDLPLEPATRGRFAKSERTILKGQDLDIPTFVRKGVKI